MRPDNQPPGLTMSCRLFHDVDMSSFLTILEPGSISHLEFLTVSPVWDSQSLAPPPRDLVLPPKATYAVAVADAVFVGFGTPEARAIHRASPAAISKHKFPAGSMGPKVDAACRFATATGKTAAIGSLAYIPAMVRGEKGTLIDTKFEGLAWHS